MTVVESPLLPPERAPEDLAAARLVRRTLAQWPLIVACALVAAVAGYVASDSRLPEYEATTTIQLNQVDLSAVVLQQNLQQQGDDTQTKAATNAKLVTLPRVREVTARSLENRISPDALKSRITVTPDTGTTLVSIAARDRDPRFAAQIADATREAFITIRQQSSAASFNQAELDLSRQLSAIPEAQRGRSTTAQELRDRIQQISTLRAISNGGVDTVQTARVPRSPISPRPKRDAILALLAGGLLGLGIALLRARLDTRIRDAEELTEMWDRPVLGLIPETKGLRDGGTTQQSASALEAFALARTNLRYLNVEGDVKSVVVTSALQDEGKSTCVWNLALAAAMADSRVLVIEADLRRPVLAQRLGLSTSAGLSEVLAGMAPFEDAVIRAQATPSPGTVAEIDVLLAGMVPPSPIALLERPRCAELLEQVSRAYDLVVIDTPPATVVADAKVLMQHADGVVVVSRLDRVKRPSFERLRDLLTDAGAPVLGFVVNGGASDKDYGYGAGYYAPVAKAVPSA